MNEVLKRLRTGDSLSRLEAFELMNQLCSEATDTIIAGEVVLALKAKSETVEEITGFVQSLKSQAVTISIARNDLMDVCGTGGDSLGTFNVSTTSAFVVAAAGQPIAKHGNRSVSSRSGSFDVLEALGLGFSSDHDQIKECIEKYNIGFLFAPAFHPVLKSLAVLRKSLGVPTIFNILGPLLNPMPIRKQIIGVFNPLFAEKMALVLKELGVAEAMVVHGHDGLDEFTIAGETHVVHLKDGALKKYPVTPEQGGLERSAIHLIKGGSAQENAEILLNVLGGEAGARRDTVMLNAGAALVVSGLARDFKEGVERAQSAVDSGRALGIVKKMRMAYAR